MGTISALDRVDSFDRTTIPGQVTVPVTDPGTMVVYYENSVEFARYADPTATGPRFHTTRPPTPRSSWATRPPPRPGGNSG